MNKLNGEQFRLLLESGANALYNHRADVDAMNVFPVPDGDTGTNMSLTIQNGIEEVKKSGSNDLATITKVFSRGLLMGARGNSGVILSQIFRGLAKYVKDNQLVEISSDDLVEALMNGARLAYKAVMKPTEGTILTVLRESTEYGQIYLNEHPHADVIDVVEHLCKEAHASLQRTPELLPVLKEAACVDSGGMGYTVILDGFLSFLNGQPIQKEDKIKTAKKEELLSGYRVEAILPIDTNGKAKYDEVHFRKQLAQFGSDIGIFEAEKEIAFSLRTIAPGEVISLAQRYGEFKKLQVEPLVEGLNASLITEFQNNHQAEKEIGMIAVAAGDGLHKLFKDYAVDYVITGGQTMNPSTEDFVKAIKHINAKKVIILPNNSNIILAAKQAASVFQDKEIYVVEAKTIIQGISACLLFNQNDTLENNLSTMEQAINTVKSASVTYAIKDTTIDGKVISAGDYMGIQEKEIVSVSNNRLKTVKLLLDKMIDETSEIVTLIYGEDTNKDEVQKIEKYIKEKFNVEIDIQEGNQPVYNYLIGVE